MDGETLGRALLAEDAPPALILLTSGGQRGDAPRFLSQGFAAYLLKPVARPRLLLDALARALKLDAQPTPPVSVDSTVFTASPPSPAAPTGARRVLVAEDNPVNRRLATLVLKKLGYAFDTAEDGEQAVRLHAATCYDAILMDCHMPNVDGLEATRRIRHQEAPHVHTPVIALTANAEQEARERCLAAGMDDYLAKPVGLVELEAVLRRWVVRDA
jgi:CheY-like chemotaxis protein